MVYLYLIAAVTNYQNHSGLKQHVYSLTALEVRRSKWNLQVWFLLKGLRENPFLASSSFWWLRVFLCWQPHHFNLGFCHHCHLFFYSPGSLCTTFIRTLVITFRAHKTAWIIPNFKILNFTTSAKSLLPNKIQFTGPRIRTWVSSGALLGLPQRPRW